MHQKTTHQSLAELAEARRKKEESARNDRRFDRYNAARIAHGLPALSIVAYWRRKHGRAKTTYSFNQALPRDLVSAHRDNITLLKR